MKRAMTYLALTAVAVVCLLTFGAKTHSAAAAGSLAGSVKLEGPAPKRMPINMSREPDCAAVHASSPALNEDVVADSAGNLQNVVVFVSAGLPDCSGALVAAVRLEKMRNWTTRSSSTGTGLPSLMAG